MSNSKPTNDDLLNVPRLRWPTRGDRLFEAANNWSADAEIHARAQTRSMFMTAGYKTAADALVTLALADEPARHELIYPIIFCYRQFIELSLKGQIAEFGVLVGLPAPKNIHNLRNLLKSFRKMCRLFGEHGSQEALIAASKCILEFDRMDPNSFTFRYATNQGGTPYPVSSDRIDLERLRDVMDGIGGLFAGSEGWLSELASVGPEYC